jgi:hypothetical protein
MTSGNQPSPERIKVLRHLRQVAARGVLTGSLMATVGIGCVDKAPGPSCKDDGIHVSNTNAFWVTLDGGQAVAFVVNFTTDDVRATVGTVTGADVASSIPGFSGMEMRLVPHSGVTSITVEVTTDCRGSAGVARFRVDLTGSTSGGGLTVTQL